MKRNSILVFVSCLVFVLPSAAAQNVTVTEEWYWAVFGTHIGDGGMVAADLEGDGSVELVASAEWDSEGYWYVLEFNGTDYIKRWTSRLYGFEITRLIVAQADDDPQLEIVLSGDYQLMVFDGVSFERQLLLAVPGETPLGLAVAEVDGDPAMEVGVCDDTGIYVYDLDTGDQQLALPAYPCLDLEFGETDGSPGLELVIANGTDYGSVLDAATGALEWIHPLGFGKNVALGDLDGDSLDEIVAGFTWHVGIQAWHGDSQAFYWEVPVDNFGELTIADVEGDGPAEVVYGDAQNGELHVLEGTTGVEKWWVDNPEGGTEHIAVGDTDGDGVNEIAFGPRIGFHLHVIDGARRFIEWTSDDLDGPFCGLAHGDVDADGDPELVFATEATSYGDSVLLVYDAVSKDLEYISHDNDLGRGGPMNIAIANLDLDAPAELVLPTNSRYDGILQCRDGLSHEVQWQELTIESGAYAAVRVADPDDDGVLEVVSTVGNRYVTVHEGLTGVLEWQSADLGSFFTDDLVLLRVADIDNDGNAEAITAEQYEGRLMAIDLVTAATDLRKEFNQVTALDTADINGDLIEDIVIGTATGWVRRVDPGTAPSTNLFGPFAGEIYGLDVEEVTGDGVLDFIFAVDDRVHLIDGATGIVEWVSEDLGRNVGMVDSLIVDDVDGDGKIEIWVNAGGIGHYIFGIENYVSIFADGFESGTISRWSVSIP